MGIAADTPSLVPQPKALQHEPGVLELTEETRVCVQTGQEVAAQACADLLRGVSGLPLPLTNDESAGNNLNLSLSTDVAAEAYRLKVAPSRISLHAADAAGLYYGAQTLRQLLPGEGRSTIPCLSIEDAPRHRWRGLHLDVGRHLFPIDFLRETLDLMALHKLNRFHWHLTEDQGWRLEIKGWPRLTEVGAWRAETPLPGDRHTLDGRPYGGFYSQEEARSLVEYARERQITIIPEIEMPGHAQAALASYPELGCLGEGYVVRCHWGISDEVYCAGNDAVFDFLESVLLEVMAIFPGEYIHVGGDECPKTRWQACPKCQARMRREGLLDEHELQSWFIRRIEGFLSRHGCRLIGWDEILEGGLAPGATVMSWRGLEGGIAAAGAGQDAVMSPNTHCYLDYYQREDEASEPPAIGGYLPLERAHEFDPLAGIAPDHHPHVLGGQGNVWTEFMPTADQVEYMTWPRAAALAEALWTAPSARDFADFQRRLRGHLPRLRRLGVNYCDPFSD
ncbi:MAG: beta-N-acetylhexosaminidase [Anaerolineaceae bacterium]|nr:beta-N-acetylhexosaminidase [Anaerolineaceae bacterium]